MNSPKTVFLVSTTHRTIQSVYIESYCVCLTEGFAYKKAGQIILEDMQFYSPSDEDKDQVISKDISIFKNLFSKKEYKEAVKYYNSSLAAEHFHNMIIIKELPFCLE